MQIHRQRGYGYTKVDVCRSVHRDVSPGGRLCRSRSPHAWAGIFCLWLGVAAIEPAFIHAESASRTKPNAAEVYEAFCSFVTGDAGVKYALVEFAWRNLATPQLKLFAFSYDDDSFYGRAYCTDRHDLNEACLNDEVCVRKGDQFWYYNGDARNPRLYIAAFLASVDPKKKLLAGAYGGYRRMDSYAGLFQTFFISDQGRNSLLLTNEMLVVGFMDDSPLSMARIVVDEQGRPSGLEIDRKTPNGDYAKQRIVLSYGVVPEANTLPESCLDPVTGFQMRILRLETLPPKETLPPTPPPFLPLTLFEDKTISHVIHSNGMDYMVGMDGQLVALDVGKEIEKEMRDVRLARFFFYVGIGTLLLLGAIAIRGFSKRSTLQSPTRNPR